MALGSFIPPGVTTTATFDNPLASALAALKLPVFIGEGNEFLSQKNVEIVRGSSSQVDEQVTSEDETSRAVVSVSTAGAVTLGAFNGSLSKFQVVNYPIVDGAGKGVTTNDPTKVTVTVNGEAVLVRTVDGAKGIVEISASPEATDVVRCTYSLSRKDTQVTDDVSAQITAGTATVRATGGISDTAVGGTDVFTFYVDQLDVNGNVVVPANNVFALTVDGVSYEITIPAGTFTAAGVALVLGASSAGTLAASTFVNNFGKSAVVLTADQSITIGSGVANAVLKFTANASDSRRKTFYVFNGPIVDGTNGGVTTTDPKKVTVKVNNTKVVPTSVDGVTRAVTLPVAPKAGDTLKITYYFNTWQDTFDYLPNINIASILRVGVVPDGSEYVESADFILKNDRIVWGSSALVFDGTPLGSLAFGEAQVSTTLIDDRTFLSVCTPVTTSSGGVSTASRQTFTLPFTPTLGDGRGTELGSSLFQSLSNGRVGLPVNRPDVVKAFWGYGVQDALDRGPVTVTRVEGNTIVLADAAGVGADVYATFYYNSLTDTEYTLTVGIPDSSGTGTYTIADSVGDSVYGASFSTATKGSSLTGVTLEFPSGSEFTPDLRFESVNGDSFTGPTEEVVTVRFAARDASPARYTFPGYGPYEIVQGASDKFRVQIDNTELVSGLAGINLNDPTTYASGFPAVLVSDEINYTGGAGGAEVGKSYSLSATEEVNLSVDGVAISAKVEAQNNVDISAFVKRINEAANGHYSTLDTGGTTTVELDNAQRSPIDDYYVGWVITMGDGAANGNSGLSRTVTAYNGTTGVATIATWAGAGVVSPNKYRIYNPATMPYLKGATQFDGPVSFTNNKFDKFTVSFEGTDVLAGSYSYTDTLDLGNGPFATAADLADEVQSQLDSSIATAIAGDATLAGLYIYCTADSSNRLQFTMQLPGKCTSGILAFVANATPAKDFAILAGLDTASALGRGQTSLIVADIAKSYELTATSLRKPYDRLFLRNRIVPGGINSQYAVDQVEFKVLAGSGNAKAGLTVNDYGTGGNTATVKPGSLVGHVGFIGGQDPIAVTGTFEPLVTFYDGTGVNAANNVFKFTVDAVPVTVTFPASSTGTATLLGPASGTSNGSVLDLIIDAMAAISGAPFGNAAAVYAAGYITREGAGIRISSKDATVSGAVLIGNGSANSKLGFTNGTVAQRSLVTARQLVSALNENRKTGASTTWLMDFTAVNGGGTETFNTLGIADVMADSAGREYVYLQSQTIGSISVITLKDPTVGGVVTDSFLANTTGFYAADADGAVGEAALDGFFVKSSLTDGSGSVNTSVLNNGDGQDGVVGQTYRDDVTGLTFTILPRGYNASPNGPWLSYPTGSNATFRVNVSKTFVTNSNIPHYAIPGIATKVANTLGLLAADTATLTTYARGGEEPKVGDNYFVSYTYGKEDMSTKFYSSMAAVERSFGTVGVENPLSLAAYLAFINGASIVGLKQVPRATGSTQASLEDYALAIEELEQPLPGNTSPDMIIPLRGDSVELYQLLKRSNSLMSSARYKSERTSILGFAAGTTPEEAKAMYAAMDSDRIRMVYPDSATITLTDNNGVTTTQLVDGVYLAAALAGSVVNPALDMSTPWTNRPVKGFSGLGRRVSANVMNDLASSGGINVIEAGASLKIRDAWTTVQSRENKLLTLPTIRLVVDEVQRQCRALLDSFIGVKFLPGIISQVEGRLSAYFRSAVNSQLITGYTGLKAIVDPLDPTALDVEVAISPCFPLLYIRLNLGVRFSLS